MTIVCFGAMLKLNLSRALSLVPFVSYSFETSTSSTAFPDFSVSDSVMLSCEEVKRARP